MKENRTSVVGIDLGDRTSTDCVYHPGVVVDWFEFAMTPAGVRSAFEGTAFRAIALEAGAHSGWVTRELRDLGYKPVVAHLRSACTTAGWAMGVSVRNNNVI